MSEIHIYCKTKAPESFTINAQRLGLINTNTYAVYIQDIAFNREAGTYKNCNLVGDIGDRNVLCEGIPQNILFPFSMETDSASAYYQNHQKIEIGRFKNMSKTWSMGLQNASTNVAVNSNDSNLLSIHIVLRKI
jgi:hypothetical protein